MARIRTVKPSLFASYSLAKVPIEARYLFIGLFTEADDNGRLIDSPKRIAGSLFPHDEKITERKVDSWLCKLQEVGSIFRYAVDGGRYIALPTWATHQKVSHPYASPIPPPDAEDLESFLSRSGAALEWHRNGAGAARA